jgi:hypothetical protein
LISSALFSGDNFGDQSEEAFRTGLLSLAVVNQFFLSLTVFEFTDYNGIEIGSQRTKNKLQLV